MMWNYRGFGYS